MVFVCLLVHVKADCIFDCLKTHNLLAFVNYSDENGNIFREINGLRAVLIGC